MRANFFWLMVMLCLTVLGGATTAAATRYIYKDLGILPGGIQSEANGINDAGQVAGTAATSTTLPVDTHAFLWTPGSPMRDLGTLAPGNSGLSWGNAVNQAVVGTAVNSNHRDHAFRWTPSLLMQDLGALNNPDNNSYAYGVNKAGDVVGYSDVGGGIVATHAFLWQNGIMTDLGTFGGTNSYAFCINDNGFIAGSYYDSANIKTRAFLRQPSGYWQDLGNLGGYAAVALGINNSGHAVGYAGDNNNYSRAFFWTPALGMKDLGTLGGYESVAKGVNNRDQVVGYTEDSHRKQRAFLWTQQGGIQDLNRLTTNLPANVTLDVAAAINNQGQIAGWASVRLNHRAFLLMPVNVTNVPQIIMLLLSP